MASADFYGRTAHVALTLHEPCLHQSRYCRPEDRPQTSPVNDNNFHPMWPLYLPADLAVGLHHFLQTRPVNRPCIQFLFVGPGLCHRASFTRPLAWSHLPSASGSALGSTAPTVDFHHLVIAHAGQTRKRGCLSTTSLFGAKGTRTLHLLIANQSLYQMSYGPKFF